VHSLLSWALRDAAGVGDAHAGDADVAGAAVAEVDAAAVAEAVDAGLVAAQSLLSVHSVPPVGDGTQWPPRHS